MPRHSNRRPGHSYSREALCEQLESRQLLTGLVNGQWPTEHINWNGANIEVVKDSWLITFTTALGKAGAEARTAQIVATLGVTLDAGSIESLGRGRWARFSTPTNLTPTQINQMRALVPGVQAMEPEGVARINLAPNDPLLGTQWAIDNVGQFIEGSGPGLAGADMSALAAWDLQTGSRNTIVAVLDTGWDFFHPDLAPNVWTNAGEIAGNNIDDDGNGFVDDVNGYDFSGGNDNNPQAAVGNDHGVAVSGCIGAVGNNGIGVSGINWQVSIIPVKIFPDTPGGAALGDIIEGIDYITMLRQSGVNIVAANGSFGGLQGSGGNQFNNGEFIAIQAFTNSGGLFVAAAGNESNDNDGPIAAYPASFDNDLLISVAATDNRDQLADFSNWGLTKVDLGAPGVRVRTTAVGGGYQYIDGTSFASPYTCGVVALLASANPYASNAQLRDAILNGVDQIEALNGKTVTGGRLNARRSLELIGFAGPIVVDINPGVTSGPTDTITVGFSKAINPSFISIAGIELRAANGDNDFNANDAFYTFSPSDISLNGSIFTIRIVSGSLPIDRYRLTLFAPYFRDLSGNYLNGDLNGGNDNEYEFSIVNSGGPYEPNDTIAQAYPIILGAGGTATITDAFLGDGAVASRDVDIYRIILPSAGLITATVLARNLASPSTLDSYLRLFDASGRELAKNDNFDGLDSRIQYFVPTGGRYYIGVSGYGNATYLPGSVGSGPLGQSNGSYNMVVSTTVAQPEVVNYANSSGVNIPSQGSITSTIFIPDVRRIQDLNVQINISHSYISDLQVRLISPSGKTIALVLNRGGPSAAGFINTRFDDSAATNIAAGTPPFNGTFHPEGNLSDVNGDSAAGNWVLQITDIRALNSGRLNSWNLELTLENSASGPFEFNDTLATATDIGLAGAGSRTFSAVIGDGAYGQRDVDLFRLVAQAGTTVTVSVTVPNLTANNSFNTLDSVLRIFDLQGNQLHIDARLDANTAYISFPVTYAGTFFIGVSGSPNTAYNPVIGGTGTASPGSGDYTLLVSVVGGLTDGSVFLSGTLLSVGIAQDGTFGATPSGGTATGINLSGTEAVVPGSTLNDTESFYGASYGGFVFRNAGPAGSDVSMTVANESDYSNRRVMAEGLFRTPIAQQDQNGGLLVRRAVTFNAAQQFLVVDVSLTNTTFSSLANVTWTEGFRPRQSSNLGSPFTRTVNNVDNATGRLATASYTDPTTFPGGFTLGLGALNPATGTVAVSVETPGSVRDASQVFSGPTDPDPSPADAGVDANGTLAIGYTFGALNAGASLNFRYFIFIDTTLAGVQGTFATLDTGSGTGHLVADPISTSLVSDDLPYALYYPEGYANSRASTFVPLVNPHNERARIIVTARYENPLLAPVVLFNEVVDGNARSGVTVTTPEMYANNTLLVTKDTPYAIEVKSSAPIGANISHYDFGVATGQAFTSQPSTTWTFSEGFKGGNVNDFLVYYNTAQIRNKVTLTIYQETSSQTFTTTQEAGPNRRFGWALNDIGFIPNGPFAIKLTSEQPIVAALTHFDSNLHGGFSILGIPSLGSTEGVSPEGQVGLNAQTEYVTILNAGTSPSTVTFTFFFEDQSAYRRQVTVPAGRRSGFNVAELPGFPATGKAYSIGYEATQPVTATLSSYAFDSATGTRFTEQAQSVWLFSDGFKPGAGNAVTEYLRLFNPTLQDVVVEITLDFAKILQQGSLPEIPAGSVSVRKTVAARSANEFNVHDFVTGARASRDSYYSISIKSAVPIVAYAGHFDAFFGSGFGTLGTSLGNISAAII